MDFVPRAAGIRPAQIVRHRMHSIPPSEHLLNALLSDPREAVIAYHPDGTLFLWNGAAKDLYGYQAAEMIGNSVRCLSSAEAPPDLPGFPPDFELDSPVLWLRSERRNKTGHRFPVCICRSPIRTPQGAFLGVLERSRFDFPEASAAEAHLRFLVEKLPLHFWTTDRRLCVTAQWGSTVRQDTNFSTNGVGQSIQQFLGCPEASDSPVKEHFLALGGITSRFEYAGGKRLYDLSIEPFRDPQGDVIGCIGMALDITERRKSEEEIRYRASHDGLTGLANYREFLETLEREVRRAGRTAQTFALLLLDLDDLKLINDRFGHLAGNQALQRLAGIMRDHCRATEIAARFGGDEFAILLLEADAERAQHVAERIRSCLRVHPNAPSLSVSIGVSVFPEDGPAACDLLETADKRLYREKKSRLRFAVPRADQGR